MTGPTGRPLPPVPPIAAMTAALGGDLRRWAQGCHAAAATLVKSGVFGDHPARVLRGTCPGVGGQHSWVGYGTAEQVYDTDLIVIDPTWWSYRPGAAPALHIGPASTLGHRPHGHGSIFAWGKPVPGNGPPVELVGADQLSEAAQAFLDLLGPLDRRGWSLLFQAPMADWPAGEILAAAHNTPGVAALVPVDRLGMLTDLNPGGLYLPGPDRRDPGDPR